MELNEIKSIWNTYDAKLEKSLKLNLHCLGLIQTQKVKSRLTPLLWHRGIEMTFHAVAIGLLLAFLVNNFNQFSYAASAILLLGFYGVAVYNCIKQIRIIRNMDMSNDIVTIQSALVMLQTNVVNHARMAVLCLPTFLAYPVVVSKAIRDLNLTMYTDFDIIRSSNGNWWTAQLVATIVLVPLCIYIYRSINYKNIHINWVKEFIQKATGTRVRKAMEFVNELESLKKDI